MILAYTIGDLFTNFGIQVAGSYQFFSVLLILMVLMFLIFIRAPGMFIVGCLIILTGTIAGWGAFTNLVLGLGAVFVGTMIALGIWRLYQKGDIP
jgi:hypothetical protein